MFTGSWIIYSLFFSYFFSLHAFGFFVIIFLCLFQFKLFIKILSLCLVIKPLKDFFQLAFGAGVLRSLPQLARLDLSHSGLGALPAGQLCNLTALTHLNISNNRQIDRQIDIQMERVIDRQLFIQRVKYKDKQVDRQIYRQINIYLSPSYNSNIL